MAFELIAESWYGYNMELTVDEILDRGIAATKDTLLQTGNLVPMVYVHTFDSKRGNAIVGFGGFKGDGESEMKHTIINYVRGAFLDKSLRSVMMQAKAWIATYNRNEWYAESSGPRKMPEDHASKQDAIILAAWDGVGRKKLRSFAVEKEGPTVKMQERAAPSDKFECWLDRAFNRDVNEKLN